MSNTQTVSTYAHCGVTTFIDVQEISGWGGDRLVITSRREGGWNSPAPTVLNLNPEQVADLERYFAKRTEAREAENAKVAAEVQHAAWHAALAEPVAANDPTPTDDDEEDATWGEPLDDRYEEPALP